MKKLFGSSGGVRGVAGHYPIDTESVKNIARSLHYLLKEWGLYDRNSILIGRDTRDSCEEIYKALVSGLGDLDYFEVYNIGVFPTNPVALLGRGMSAVMFSIMITASHNHYSENGLKIFSYYGNGYVELMPENLEKKIEDLCVKFSENRIELYKRGVRKINYSSKIRSYYANYLAQNIGTNISQKKVVLDCANGSFSDLVEEIKSIFGNIIIINNTPNGKNINLNCGSLFPEETSKKVLEVNADMGMAFDGDGDRIVLVDENGTVIDTDKVIAFLALEKKKEDITKNKVVVTEYTNLAFDEFMKENNIEVIRTKNGERNVTNEMFNHESVAIGGEYSGHIILKGISVAGDGLLIGGKFLSYLQKNNLKASNITNLFEMYPSTLVNVKVKEKIPFEEIKAISDEIDRVNKELSTEGRLIIRYSGTENVCRIFIEGKNIDKIKDLANALANIVTKELSL